MHPNGDCGQHQGKILPRSLTPLHHRDLRQASSHPVVVQGCKKSTACGIPAPLEHGLFICLMPEREIEGTCVPTAEDCLDGYNHTAERAYTPRTTHYKCASTLPHNLKQARHPCHARSETNMLGNHANSQQLTAGPGAGWQGCGHGFFFWGVDKLILTIGNAGQSRPMGRIVSQTVYQVPRP